MKKHSQGPWAHHGEFLQQRLIKNASGTTIAMTIGGGEISNEEDEANAHVLSAAEELLAVAEGFEVRPPDANGDVWLVLTGGPSGAGTTGRGMVNLGKAGGIVAQVALLLEQLRAAAVRKAAGQ